MNNLDYKLYFYLNNELFKKIGVERNHTFNLVIGSGSTANVILENKQVSRNHLQLIYNDKGELLVQDLGSTNGTVLNNFRLIPGQDKILKPHDKLYLGRSDGGVLIVIEKAKDNKILNTQTDILDKLKKKRVITIGRHSSCDIILDSETVSRRHASLTKLSNGAYTIQDLGSRNGTFINGKKIRGISNITLKDKIYIGRHQLSLKGKTKDLSDELAICALGIEKTYSNGVKALKKMDLLVPSKSMLAVMGPSGCGKSTLLKALNGDTPASKGKVLIFNQELLSNYDYLKTQIGYVPQDDIVHSQLTVQQCLYFTAKLRLDNSSDAIIEGKINRILTELNILEKKHNLIKNLSGGQRKRVSIAVELITDPLILFLDEPTSPLDPQTVEGFLLILKKLSEKGTTVIMVTHKPEDLEYMDEVVFMAEGGNIVYHGNSKEYKEAFGVKTAVAVFAQIAGKSAKYWVDKYKNTKLASSSRTETNEIKHVSNKTSINQFYWLTRRYLKIKTNDKINSAIMLIQAPIIAILICIIFKNISSAVLFMIAISAIWLGTQNAAREIVSESAIYKRERMFNLQILPYILSKISVLSFFSIIQCAVFILILSTWYGRDSSLLEVNTPINAFIWMSFISIASTFLGLLLSSIVNTTEKAMTIVPLILIPQIMLAGLIAKVNNSFVELISYFTLSRWGVEGFNSIQEDIIGLKPNPMPNEIGEIEIEMIDSKMNAIDELLKMFHSSYTSTFKLAGTLKLDIYFIIIMIIVMLFFIFKTLKNKDSVSM